MPEKDKETTLEKPKEEEEKIEEEEKKKGEKTKKPSKPEKKTEEEEEIEEKEEEEEKEEIEPKEPPRRFPKKEQTPEEKRKGFSKRKEREKRFEEGKDEFEDEDDQPITRGEMKAMIEKQSQKDATDRLVDVFIVKNPSFKRYEKRIRKYAKDPDYSNVPIGFIASGIVGENIDDEANLRAKLKIKADKEAEKTKLGGSVKRGLPKEKKIWDMTPEEFQEKQTEVLRKQGD